MPTPPRGRRHAAGRPPAWSDSRSSWRGPPWPNEDSLCNFVVDLREARREAREQEGLRALLACHRSATEAATRARSGRGAEDLAAAAARLAEAAARLPEAAVAPAAGGRPRGLALSIDAPAARPACGASPARAPLLISNRGDQEGGPLRTQHRCPGERAPSQPGAGARCGAQPARARRTPVCGPSLAGPHGDQGPGSRTAGTGHLLCRRGRSPDRPPEPGGDERRCPAAARREGLTQLQQHSILPPEGTARADFAALVRRACG